MSCQIISLLLRPMTPQKQKKTPISTTQVSALGIPLTIHISPAWRGAANSMVLALRTWEVKDEKGGCKGNPWSHVDPKNTELIQFVAQFILQLAMCHVFNVGIRGNTSCFTCMIPWYIRDACIQATGKCIFSFPKSLDASTKDATETWLGRVGRNKEGATGTKGSESLVIDDAKWGFQAGLLGTKLATRCWVLSQLHWWSKRYCRDVVCENANVHSCILRYLFPSQATFPDFPTESGTFPTPCPAPVVFCLLLPYLT